MNPQIGDPVVVRFLDSARGSMPSTVAGTLGVALNADGKLEDIVVSTDGGATTIPQADVLAIELDA